MLAMTSEMRSRLVVESMAARALLMWRYGAGWPSDHSAMPTGS